MIKVKLFANFREAAGKKEVSVRSRNIEDLIDELVMNYPPIEELIKLEDYLHVMVNGKYIDPHNYKNTELNDGDVVAIFPPVSGG